MVLQQSWKELRLVFVKENNSLLAVPPAFECAHYLPIEAEFPPLNDVAAHEQEVIVEQELGILFMGHQTENIRLQFDSKSTFPSALNVNPSFDPYLRESIEHFSKFVINLYTVRKCSYEIMHDRLHFSTIGRIVAHSIEVSTTHCVKSILQGLAKMKSQSQESVIKTMNKRVSMHSVLLQHYAAILKEIYEKRLVGGEVLQLLHGTITSIVDSDTLKALLEHYKKAWKQFLSYISSWVNYGLINDYDFEFFVWSTAGINNAIISTLSSSNPRDVTVSSPNFVPVPALCPAFLAPNLQLILKCGDFKCIQREVKDKPNAIHDWKNDSHGEVSLLLDSPQLDVPFIIRKLEEIDTQQSMKLLRELKAKVDLDTALRDIHQLLYGLNVVSELLLLCRKEYANLVFQPVEQHNKRVLERISHRLLHGNLQEDYYSFWKYFSFALAQDNLIMSLCDRNICTGGAPEASDLESLMFYNSLTLTFTPPPELERVIPAEVVAESALVFRLYLQLAFALDTISDRLFELGEEQPARSIVSSPSGQQRYVAFTMHSLLQTYQLKLIQAIDVTLKGFPDKVNQATTIEELIQAQCDVPYFIMKYSGLNEWKRMEPFYELIKLSFFCTSDKEMKKVLPDLQARVDAIHEQFATSA